MENRGQYQVRKTGQGDVQIASKDNVTVVKKPELATPSEINPAVDLASKIAHGEAPSNKELSGVLDSTKSALEEEVAHRGNAPEVRLAQHAENFLDSCKIFLNEKNKDEKLQAFVKDTQQALQELQEQTKIAAQKTKEKALDEGTKEEFRGKAEEIKGTAMDSVRSIKSLVLMLIDSYEFRALLVDTLGWIQDIAKAEWRQTQHQPPSFSKEEEKYQAALGKPLAEEISEKSEQAKEFAAEVINDISEGNLPIDESRKQELRDRLADLIRRFGDDDRFQRALQGAFHIFEVAEDMALRAKEQAEVKGKEISQSIPENEGLRKMWHDGRALLEQFVGKESLDSFIDHVQDFMEVARDDVQMRVFFRELRGYLNTTIQNPDLVYDEEYQKQAYQLMDFAVDWLNDPKYKDRLDLIWKDLNTMFENMKNDETRKRLADDTRVLAQDLFLDSTGRPSLNVTQHGINNVRSLLAPILKKNLEILNFPLIAGSNKEYDYEIRDLTLNAANIVPDRIEVRLWADANIALNEGKSEAVSYLTVWIRDVGISASDVKFDVKRKVFPTLHNYGRANIAIYGNNQLRITWKVKAEADKPIELKLYSLKCYIDHLKHDIIESNHTLLDKMILSLWHSNIKKKLEESVENSIRDTLYKFDVQVTEALRSQS